MHMHTKTFRKGLKTRLVAFGTTLLYQHNHYLGSMATCYNAIRNWLCENLLALHYAHTSPEDLYSVGCPFSDIEQSLHVNMKCSDLIELAKFTPILTKGSYEISL